MLAVVEAEAGQVLLILTVLEVPAVVVTAVELEVLVTNKPE
jgi:hypothetical protein